MYARIAAIFAFLAVVLGALGAHYIEFSKESLEDAWKTAVSYQLIHAVVLFFLGQREKVPEVPCIAFMVGMVLFSGSIYLLAIGGPSWLGPVTPVGGVAFLVGWAWLAGPGWKK